MASNVTFDITAFNRFLTRVVQPYLMGRAEEIAREAKQRAPQGATGDLRNSITVERGPNGGARVKVGADHAGFVHQGTGPQHQPNPHPQYYPRLRRRGLILWSESKNLNPYQVAHGISENGTPANPFFEAAIENVLGKLRFRWIRRELNL